MATLELSALRRRRETWELIGSELVRVGADYYRPKARSIRGRDEILAFVDSHEHADLCESIRRVMGEAPRDYVIADGRLSIDRATPRSTRPASRTKARSESRELARLRAKCEGLETRVASLESTLKRLARASRSGASSNAPRPSSNAPSASASAAPAGASPPSPSSPSPSSPDSSSPSPEEKAPSPPSDGSPEATSSEAESVLSFPTVDACATVLGELLGHAVELTQASDLEPGPGTHSAPLMSDAGEEVGLVMVDLAAIIAHGGGLAMLDDEAAQEMVAAGAPSADIVDAMGEVVSAQVRCFNQVQGNPRVRAESLRPYDASLDAWALAAPRQVAADARGGMTLFASK